MGRGGLGKWGGVGHSDGGRGTVGEAPTSSGGTHLPVWGCGTVCYEQDTTTAFLEAAQRESQCAAHEQR